MCTILAAKGLCLINWPHGTKFPPHVPPKNTGGKASNGIKMAGNATIREVAEGFVAKDHQIMMKKVDAESKYELPRLILHY